MLFHVFANPLGELSGIIGPVARGKDGEGVIAKAGKEIPLSNCLAQQAGDFQQQRIADFDAGLIAYLGKISERYVE
ncbi:MAG: hypothetical protein P8166_12115 [Candidatus Thiodiazotropha sp.]